jgi:hypothetical protein
MEHIYRLNKGVFFFLSFGLDFDYVVTLHKRPGSVFDTATKKKALIEVISSCCLFTILEPMKQKLLNLEGFF